jgi:hypothetical protein
MKPMISIDPTDDQSIHATTRKQTTMVDRHDGRLEG